MRTICGWTFRCKSCGKKHFYAFGTNTKTVKLGCTENKYAVNTYNPKDFIDYYHGWTDYYINAAIVKEIE